MSRPAGRLLDTGAGEPDWNMAVDDALLESVRLGLSPPTLRVYRWSQPTLSFGHAQRLLPAPGGYDTAPASGAQLALVRRPTGGRAVLHAGDFTYAVATAGLPVGVRASYAVLAEGLTRALGRLGVLDASMGSDKSSPRSAACFASATTADLCNENGKLMGSAQARRGAAVLQHGTLYSHYPVALAKQAFGTDYVPVNDLLQALGHEPGWQALSEAFAWGLGAALETEWETGELTSWELEHVAGARKRYIISTLQ
jgi:lipoate-protein ligase A